MKMWSLNRGGRSGRLYIQLNLYQRHRVLQQKQQQQQQQQQLRVSVMSVTTFTRSQTIGTTNLVWKIVTSA